MTQVYKSTFRYIANRYEEWQGGRCISSGEIQAIIIAEVSGDQIDFRIRGIDGIRMANVCSYDLRASSLLPDRVQYIHGTTGFDPNDPVICHVFYKGDTIDYVRFAMTNPDRIVEFYGYMDVLIQKERRSQPCVNEVQNVPSRERIELMIQKYDTLQRLFVKMLARGKMEAFKSMLTLHAFAAPVFYAWEVFGYGGMYDFWSDERDLGVFDYFKRNSTEQIRNQYDMLKSGHFPFYFIDYDGTLKADTIALLEALLRIDGNNM